MNKEEEEKFEETFAKLHNFKKFKFNDFTNID